MNQDEHNILIDIRAPIQAVNDINKFKKKMDEYDCQIIDDVTKYRINLECYEFEEYLKDNFPDFENRCRIKSSLGYSEGTWTINEIKKYHAKYCSDIHKNKREYTVMEVNNMLFNLEIEDVIGGYVNITTPGSFDTGVWNGMVKVYKRYFI